MLTISITREISLYKFMPKVPFRILQSNRFYAIISASAYYNPIALHIRPPLADSVHIGKLQHILSDTL